MPQDSPLSGRRDSTGETGQESTATQTGSHPAHATMPVAEVWGIGLLFAVGAIALVYHIRGTSNRVWKRYASEIGGEFKPLNRFTPSYVSGEVQERTLFMEASTNHDDEIPYYHTRVSTPISNPAQVVLGLRRKSMLEEAQSRNEAPAYEFGDTDFDRRFHLICNDMSKMPDLLGSDLRTGLLKFGDIEIYVRPNLVEWRRAGEVSDLKQIRWLNKALVDVASKLDALPARAISLSERLEYEDKIRKGI